MSTKNLNSFKAMKTLSTRGGTYTYFDLGALTAAGYDVSRLPYSIRVLLESTLRNEDGHAVTKTDIENIASYDPKNPKKVEIPFHPSRVILQDFTGVPAVVDLAALRSAMHRMGGNPERINPQIPVDLVIDHSVQVDAWGNAGALQRNSDIEFARNNERYAFLRWGQKAFKNFGVVPPASGIVHQVNLEYLARVAWTRNADGSTLAYPDSLVGTDSHTTMINGLGVLGWGVGGIEAEAVMLNQPIYMLIPDVIGFKITGKMPEGATATDLVLRVTQMLRKKGVVEKFVEFYGPGLSSMSLPDRATIANMAPEYGATVGFFPVDDETLRYLRRSGRPAETVELVEQYYKAQNLFRTDDSPEPVFTDTLELDLGDVRPALAGPKRPQDRIDLTDVAKAFDAALTAPVKDRGFALAETALANTAPVEGLDAALNHGSVVIAAITSCTNTSNPSVLLAAGLVAKKAIEKGLTTKPWVKASLAPGSKVVTDYLDKTGLSPYLDKAGFFTVGYGCTTCIGNSGPLPQPIVDAIAKGDLIAASVLSGNRNFEGRVHPNVKANYLASPPLCVAYALAGTVRINFATDPIGTGSDGNPVFLKDIWPTNQEISDLLDTAMDPDTFRAIYSGIENKNTQWNAVPAPDGAVYDWDLESTYIQEPPFFTNLAPEPAPIRPIREARALAKLGDSITTDHISPAGDIAKASPAGKYLVEKGVEPTDFNSYGSRRGNDRIMTRGTFANIRLKNQLAPGTEGGYTTHIPTGQVTSIYEAAEQYKKAGTPTIVLAGVDYGMGSSRDWAAKGTFLLGVRAVIAKSFERIHRSNLVGMGVLPLVFLPGEDADTLGLTGKETFNIDIDDDLKPGATVIVEVVGDNGTSKTFKTLCRIDTPVELDYYRNGGILQTVLRNIYKQDAAAR